MNELSKPHVKQGIDNQYSIGRVKNQQRENIHPSKPAI